MAAMQIRGFGETVLAADFDNDGDIDVFLPHYTHRGDGGHNWLLVNDGAGRFTDIAATAGVAINQLQPEGAQALDINGDGWIDIHVAGHVFVNNGDLTFTDQAPVLHTPILFDEGMRLFDVDLDGDFDLVHHDSFVTRLFRNNGGTFAAGVVVDPTQTGSSFGYGLSVCDLNGDGFEDVIVASNDRTAVAVGQPRLLLKVGGTLVRSSLQTGTARYNDLLACDNLDGSGLPDVVGRWSETVGFTPGGDPIQSGRFRVYLNRSTSTPTIRLRILGANGTRNQQGRLVRVRPVHGPDVTMTRVVESGSNRMAQNGYDLQLAPPWPGPYEVSVRFATGWVQTTAQAGDTLTISADGSVVPGLK